MSRCGFLGELDIIDKDINDLRLRQLDITISLLLDVNTKVILNISLGIETKPYSSTI